MTIKHLSAALLAAALSLSAQAEEAVTQPAATPPPPAQPMGGPMGNMNAMGGMMMSDERLKQKQEHLLKMHDLSNKILAATDPKEKDKLKAEQLELMRAHDKEHHMMMQQMMMQKPGGMGGMTHNPPPPAH
jgi:hypothetical protein